MINQMKNILQVLELQKKSDKCFMSKLSISLDVFHLKYFFHHRIETWREKRFPFIRRN